MAYSVTKAAGLHLMKCLTVTQGSKIRINAVLPGLLLTEWVQDFPQERLDAINQRSILRKEASKCSTLQIIEV